MSDNGKLYNEMKLQPWDVIIQNFNGSGANADRAGVKDLEKAKAFIDKLIEYDRRRERYLRGAAGAGGGADSIGGCRG